MVSKVTTQASDVGSTVLQSPKHQDRLLSETVYFSRSILSLRKTRLNTADCVRSISRYLSLAANCVKHTCGQGLTLSPKNSGDLNSGEQC